MSRILNRPMFRGGGKVSSYGNGIATGLADGGRVNLEGGGSPFGGFANKVTQSPFSGGQAVTGAGIMNYLKNVPYLGRAIPFLTGAGATMSAGATAGAGGAKLTDMFLKAGDTPEAYAYRKQAQKDNPYMNMETDISFDKDGTMTSQGEIVQDEINRLDVGEKYGFLPRGGPETRLKELGLTGKFDLDGNKITVKEDDSVRQTDAELRAQMENKRLTKLLNDFTSGSKKKDTKEEAVAAIKERQELMEEVMGGGKAAKIQDASDMAISFASKALGEGATVKSAFADFLGDESKRPSRSQKVKDAAANAAIQSYLTEQMSEKDFSKQMQLITGQAQIKQKFANAAKANLTVQDYVTNRSNNTSKSEAIENGARGIVQNNDRYKGFTAIDSEDNIPGLLVKENLGEVFLDKKTKEVFAVVILEDGITVGKELLYN